MSDKGCRRPGFSTMFAEIVNRPYLPSLVLRPGRGGKEASLTGITNRVPSATGLRDARRLVVAMSSMVRP
jgi:hypothetical protein